MAANKLLYLLSRPEVQEVALQVGKPPCALINGTYRKITPTLLTEDELIALLAVMSGREHLLGLPDGRSWEHQSDVGAVRVLAAYDGSVLKASLRLAQPAVDKPSEQRASRRPPAKRASQAPKRASQAPKRASQAPKRASRRPPAQGADLDSLDIPASPPARRASKRPAPAPVVAAFSEAPPSTEAPPLLAPQPVKALRFRSADFEVAAAPPPQPQPQPQPQRDPAEPAPVLVTTHDAFNFEPASPWADRPDLEARPAAPPRRALPKFEGDALDDLLGHAREQRATDVHVLADRPPMLRVAGELVQQTYVITADQAEQLILARVPAAAQGALEQDGSCDFSLIHPAYGRFRANVTRQRTGIKLTARPIGDHVPTLAELGLPETIARAVEHHQGLIVITGPTGHGKTTTLAAIVGIINRETRHHVITVEDPVEYIHPTAKAVISQREVGTHTKSFQAALKGSLREDPDVIVVGELRDTETVRMALSASETGHLVISTMNTPSAAKAIERLIDLFPPGDQPQVRMTLAGGLRLIVSQRLLPNADRTGLCAAAEVLPGNVPLWNLIRENRTYQIASLQQRGKALGIIRLDESLAQLVRSGRTTMEHAKPLAEQPEHFEALVAGRPIIQRPQEPAPAPNAAARAAGQAAKAAAGAMAAATPKKAADLGKSMLSRAGKLFGNEG